MHRLLMLDFGIDSQTFAARHAETRPYLHRAALAEVPLPWAELDALLHHLEPTEDGLQLHRQGLIPQPHYVAERIAAGRRRRVLVQERFYGELRRGATLVLNRVEAHWQRAQSLCSAVRAFTGLSTTSNAYLGFGGGPGNFGPHWDTHDVFALQMIGRKRWQVFEPSLVLPLSQQRSQGSEHRPPTVPVLDVVLEAGDLLYLPRGWWHHVLPFDEPSLHLSVGSYGPTVYDYLLWIASRHFPEQPAARAGLAGPALPAALPQVLEGFAEAASNPANLAAFRRLLQEREAPDLAAFDLGRLDSRR